MATLTKGRKEIACRDNIGGVKYVYLLDWYDYTIAQIEGIRSGLITNFPKRKAQKQKIYRYEIADGNFNETINNDEEGINYSQSLSFTILQQSLNTTQELRIVSHIDLRYIVELNDGSYRMGGAMYGANVVSLEMVSGGAKSDQNAYNLTIESDERYKAPYLSDLSLFNVQI